MRSVSELLALLVAVGIAVAVSVPVTLLLGGLGQRLQPTGAAVAIQAAKVEKLTANGRYLQADIVVQFGGSESAKCDWVGIVIDETEYDGWITSPSPGVSFTPGTTVTYTARFDNLPRDVDDYYPVAIVIGCVGVSGVQIRASIQTYVSPYRI